MNTITREERELVFNDLIKYYQFCKKDRRNHIFNAINFGRRDLSEQDKKAVKDAFKKAKTSYSYYRRLKTVALLLKLNLIGFVTQEEQIQVLDDAIFYYEGRIKTKEFHIKMSKGKIDTDEKEYNAYLRKLEIVKNMRKEIQ